MGVGRSGSTTTGGGHGPINGENENQNPGDYGNLYGMPTTSKAHGKGSSFSDVLEDLSQGADIARTPGAANRGEVRAVLFRVQGTDTDLAKREGDHLFLAMPTDPDSTTESSRAFTRQRILHSMPLRHLAPEAERDLLLSVLSDQRSVPREDQPKEARAGLFWMWSLHARACSVESDKGTVPDLSGGRSRALNRVAPNSGRTGGTAGRYDVWRPAVPFTSSPPIKSRDMDPICPKRSG